MELKVALDESYLTWIHYQLKREGRTWILEYPSKDVSQLFPSLLSPDQMCTGPNAYRRTIRPWCVVTCRRRNVEERLYCDFVSPLPFRRVTRLETLYVIKEYNEPSPSPVYTLIYD